jgi:hypothetical protein
MVIREKNARQEENFFLKKFHNTDKNTSGIRTLKILASIILSTPAFMNSASTI